MTTLTKPITRKVPTWYRGELRYLVVTLAPEGVWIREPRRKTRYLTGYGLAFQRAVKDEVDAKKREKTKGGHWFLRLLLDPITLLTS